MTWETRTASPKKGNWLLWWMIGTAELRDQVANYGRYGVHRSARGISALMMLFSASATIVAIEFVNHQRLNYIDVALFVALAVFMYLGHRWALIAGMVVWTAEKVILGATVAMQGHFVGPLLSVLWWAFYMHAMYLAIRVEQARRANADVNAAVFD